MKIADVLFCGYFAFKLQVKRHFDVVSMHLSPQSVYDKFIGIDE